MPHDVIVVGGGIAGLTAAFKLMRAGVDVVLLEAEADVGGNVRSEVIDGHRVERGPHTFMASAQDIFALIEEAGLGRELIASRPEAAARFIARDGRLIAMPSGLGSFLATPLLSWSSKWTLATEPLRTGRGDPGETAQQFFERRFGSEAARVLAGAFISGVYAGDPATLSAPAAFPLFWDFEQRSGGMIRGAMRLMKERKAARVALGDAAPPRRQGLWSLRRGLGQLTTALGAHLRQRCRTRSAVRAIWREGEAFLVKTDDEVLSARQVVVAAPPPAAARMLADLDGVLAAQLEGIPMAPVAVTHLGFAERQATIPEGFGFLVPRGEGVRTLGVLFPSRLFDGRAPEDGDLLSGYVGGMLDQGALDLDEEEIAGVVRNDLAALRGLESKPSLQRVIRHRAAIPQLILGHLERVERIRTRLAAVPGLHLAGNYLYGVGIKDAVRSGLEAAVVVRREKVAQDAPAVEPSVTARRVSTATAEVAT